MSRASASLLVFVNGVLYVLAAGFIGVGGLLLAVFLFYAMSSYVGVDPDPNLALGGLLCVAVGLLICVLISLAQIRRKLQRREDQR